MSRWTEAKPTEPGWYWYADEYYGPAPVRVEWTGFIDNATSPGVRQLDVVWPEEEPDTPTFKEASGMWAGPIAEPNKQRKLRNAMIIDVTLRIDAAKVEDFSGKTADEIKKYFYSQFEGEDHVLRVDVEEATDTSANTASTKGPPDTNPTSDLEVINATCKRFDDCELCPFYRKCNILIEDDPYVWDVGEFTEPLKKAREILNGGTFHITSCGRYARYITKELKRGK